MVHAATVRISSNPQTPSFCLTTSFQILQNQLQKFPLPFFSIETCLVQQGPTSSLLLSGGPIQNHEAEAGDGRIAELSCYQLCCTGLLDLVMGIGKG
ncbi:hypothetical protein VNO78_20851 [Psophocarpus tetragonolobus]|uniref:Uncharacterized protein n=1 Tax=Psophocarpus tetragonolobus TaxID=3891 RepID=A0AAN9SFH3_PSOTE